MQSIIRAGTVALALVIAQAQGAFAQMGVSPADREFMIEAANGGIFEVEAGRLASQRAATDAVRQFGERMMMDHAAANQELVQLAQRKGVSLPYEMSPVHRATVNRLATLSGPQFDHAYMVEMVKDHQEDAALFDREVRQGQDAEVRAWASRTLATVQQHQRIAGDLHARIVQAPVTVVPMPAASPATVTVITTVTPVTPYCGGAYAADAGTNFGTCGR